jgi:hypothetical protein
MNVIEQAKQYLTKVSGLARAVKMPIWKALTPEVQEEAARIRKDSFYAEENRLADKRQVHTSPDESYTLIVDYYGTGKGTWNYTRGRVYHHNGDNPIADVKRNYSSFGFAWVEHPNGTCYLFCGEDYQSHTVVNLDTGEMETTAIGFCWATLHSNAGSRYFAIEGCFWGGPYDVVAYDLENPMVPKKVFQMEGDFGGWIDLTSFKMVGLLYDAVDLPGHPLHGKSENDCSMDDLTEVEREAAERGLEETDDTEAGWVEVQEDVRIITLPEDATVKEVGDGEQ